MNHGFMDMMQNATEVYDFLCNPICEKANIQRSELKVLLFLANNTGKDTATDIQKHGGMKPGLLSMVVEKLVQGGYLERQPIPGDRRKVRLVCTEKAVPVIEEGREVQKRLVRYMMTGVTQEEKEIFSHVISLITQNIFDCKNKMLRGELE